MVSGTPAGFGRKLGISILGGIIVGGSAAIVDATVLVPRTREVAIHHLAGVVIATLVATLICLALQLRNEELHYRFAMERAAIVAELNHHVRNAIFPLCLAVERTGDLDAQRMSNEAIERINIAMKDAATDVFAMKINYGRPAKPERQAATE